MSKLGDAVSTTGPVLPIGGGKGVTGGLCLLRSLTAEGMKLALPLFFSIQGQQHIFYQRTGSESSAEVMSLVPGDLTCFLHRSLVIELLEGWALLQSESPSYQAKKEEVGEALYVADVKAVQMPQPP